jgi:hypothetical protein
MDIQPVGGSPHNPFDALGGHDIQWLAENYPLTKYGDDLPNQCLPSFQLRRSDLMETPTAKAKGIYAFVIIDGSLQPVGGDRTIACFSNCARYAFPLAPAANCSDTDPSCYRWKAFCLNAPAGTYTKKCSTMQTVPTGLGVGSIRALPSITRARVEHS